MYETIIQDYLTPEEKRTIKSRYTKAGLAILADLLIFQLVSRIFLTIVGLYTGAGGSITEIIQSGQEAVISNDYISVMFSIGFPIIAEVTAIILGIKMLGIDIKSKFGRDGYNVSEIAGGTTLGFFLQTAAVLVIMVIFMLFKGGTEGVTNNVIVQKTALGANIVLYFYVCIFGPLLEELLFRGIVLEVIRPYNERFAIVFSALIFGLMHGNITQAVNGFMIGLVLGALYVRSGSLVPSTAMHMLMNSVTSVLSVMMYSDANLVDDLMSGRVDALTGLPMAGIVLNLIIRVVTFPAGIAIIVVTALKGFGLRKANAAGKNRAAPLVFGSPVWIAVIIAYTAVIAENF